MGSCSNTKLDHLNFFTQTESFSKYGSCKDVPYGNALTYCRGICLNVIQHDNVNKINRGLLN